MEKFYHELMAYLKTPQGIMELLNFMAPLLLVIYAIKRFSLDYKKPILKVLQIQPVKDYDNKEDIYCHIKLQIDNPASFDNTAYITVKTLTNRLVSPFFYPKEDRHKILIPANGDVIHILQVYDTISERYRGRCLKLCLTDSKGKTSTKYIRWQKLVQPVVAPDVHEAARR